MPDCEPLTWFRTASVTGIGTARRAMPVAAVLRRSCHVQRGMSWPASSSMAARSLLMSLSQPFMGTLPFLVKTKSPFFSKRDRIDRTVADSGTLWSRLFFTRSAGIVRTPSSSISPHFICATSLSRWPVSSTICPKAPTGSPRWSQACQNQPISSSDRTRSLDRSGYLLTPLVGLSVRIP